MVLQQLRTHLEMCWSDRVEWEKEAPAVCGEKDACLGLGWLIKD